MTLAEFVTWCRAQGIQDGDQLAYIRFVSAPERAEKHTDDDGAPSWNID